MANISNIENMLHGIKDQQTQLILIAANRYLVQRGIAFGRATDPNKTMVPAQNMQGGFFTATTPSTANKEFTIAHDFGRAPYLLVPILPLDQVNAVVGIQLTLTRAADATYVYLKSPTTSVPIFVYLEG